MIERVKDYKNGSGTEFRRYFTDDAADMERLKQLDAVQAAAAVAVSKRFPRYTVVAETGQRYHHGVVKLYTAGAKSYGRAAAVVEIKMDAAADVNLHSETAAASATAAGLTVKIKLKHGVFAVRQRRVPLFNKKRISAELKTAIKRQLAVAAPPKPKAAVKVKTA